MKKSVKRKFIDQSKKKKTIPIINENFALVLMPSNSTNDNISNYALVV